MQRRRVTPSLGSGTRRKKPRQSPGKRLFNQNTGPMPDELDTEDSAKLAGMAWGRALATEMTNYRNRIKSAVIYFNDQRVEDGGLDRRMTTILYMDRFVRRLSGDQQAREIVSGRAAAAAAAAAAVGTKRAAVPTAATAGKKPKRRRQNTKVSRSIRSLEAVTLVDLQLLRGFELDLYAEAMNLAKGYPKATMIRNFENHFADLPVVKGRTKAWDPKKLEGQAKDKIVSSSRGPPV